MGRGAQAQTQNMVDQQFAQQNALNQQMYQQNQVLGSQVAGGYQNLINNPGYTPDQQSAIQNQSMGALGSAFAALASSAADRVARTNNSAGYGDMLAELSRQQGREASSLTQQNQLAFADRSLNDQIAGLQGLAGLYGVDTNQLASAMGIPTGLLNVRQANSRGGPGFLSSLGEGLGQAVGKLPMVFMGG